MISKAALGGRPIVEEAIGALHIAHSVYELIDWRRYPDIELVGYDPVE